MTQNNSSEKNIENDLARALAELEHYEAPACLDLQIRYHALACKSGLSGCCASGSSDTPTPFDS